MPDYHLGPLYLYVEDESLYMESGYLSGLAVGPCAAETALPATLNYTGTVAGYINTTETPLQGHLSVSTNELLEEFPFNGEALADASESLAVGCDVKLDSVTDQCGNTYTAGGYCIPEVIFKKKKVLTTVPASMFSGKLRLMVQSIYGSKRTDVSLIEAEGFVVPGKIKIAGFTVSAFYGPSYGLFSAPDFRYFLVEISNQVKYYPILITDKAQAIVDILVDHPRNNEPAFVKKVEAYILSTAKVDEDNVIVGGYLSGLDGEPLAYGWHWNWTGHQADIVLQSDDIINHRYRTKQYSLSLSYIDGVFSESLSLVDEGYWWPQLGGLNVFVPDYFSNKALVKVPVLEEIGNGVPVPGTEGAAPDSPLHCFRTMSDELIVVRHSSNLTIRTDEELVTGDPGCTDEEKLDQLFQINNGVFGTTTLQIGSVTYTGIAYSTRSKSEVRSYPDGSPVFDTFDYSSSGNFQHQFDPMCGGMTLRDYLVSTGKFAIVGGTISSGSSGTTEVDGIVYNNVYGLAHFTQSRHRETEQSTSDLFMSTEIFIQLPFYDCSSIFWAYRSVNIVDDRRVGVEGPRQVFGGTSIWDYHYNGSTYLPFQEVVPVYPAQVGNLAATTITYGPYQDVDSRVGYVNLYRYSGGESSELIYTEADSAPLGSYFDIDYFVYPFVDQFDWVRGDTSGGYKYMYKSAASADTSYPGDSSVGWA